MKFYYDTEFIEGTQKKFFGHTPPTIDLISIGIVNDEGKRLYLISKDFNFKEAWNRYQTERVGRNLQGNLVFSKVYWIRENVLFPIFNDLYKMYIPEEYQTKFGNYNNFKGYLQRLKGSALKKERRLFKQLLDEYGFTKSQIADKVARFLLDPYYELESIYDTHLTLNEFAQAAKSLNINPELVAYYGAFDHVAFAWLFGKMIDMPEGLSWYSSDLKVDIDNLCKTLSDRLTTRTANDILEEFKNSEDYPKNKGEHNALQDAVWNKELDEFITQMKRRYL